MPSPILVTKLYIPSTRTKHVNRPDLIKHLHAGLNRKLTLISAPAGFGKTTLVSAWVDALRQDPHEKQHNIKFAWLSLDERDNDQTRFLVYLISALRTIEENIASGMLSNLQSPQPPPFETTLTILINEIAAIPDRIILVLDDYHLIQAQPIHDVLTYLLENQPPNIHLVVATREDPPIPLARLRAKGQLSELRANNLRFTSAEAAEFLNQVMGLKLSVEDISALETRTEGWITGLQLAAISLQGSRDSSGFIASFTGSHRFVLEYLIEEVIRQQEPEIRQFLIQTSIFERFNAAACEAITGFSNSRAILDRLEQTNMFIISLDHDRNWYRYHQLFADYLNTELTNNETAELCKKASVWHEANDLVFDAVRYALASGDSDFFADVINRTLSIDTVWSGGNLAQYLSWVDAIPPDDLLSRPQLSLNAAHIYYLAGRFELAEKRISQTEQILKSQSATPEVEQMLALAALYRGSIASVRGDTAQAIEQTNFAQERLPRENNLAHARAFFSLGLAYELAGQSEHAAKNYLLSSDEAKSAGVLYLAIHARCAAAQVQISQGRLHLAEQACQNAIQLADNQHLAPLGLAWSILGGIALERDDLAAAEKLLSDGIALSRLGGLMDDVILGLAYLARLRTYQGNTTATFAAIQEASEIIQGFGVERVSTLAPAHLARLQIYSGEWQSAVRWAAEYQAIRGESAREFEDLTLVRVLIMNGNLENVPSLLNPLFEQAQDKGRWRTCMEVMILFALFQRAQKDIPAAVDWLSQALGLAAPEGFIRIFLDEGPPLLELLPQARQAAPDLVDAILESQHVENGTKPSPMDQLPEPLTNQELRVLALIIAGNSNQQIAEELVISMGTAKWHVHNILQKLGVSNRSQAIARARELGF